MTEEKENLQGVPQAHGEIPESEQRRKMRIRIENAVILILAALSAVMLVLSFFPAFGVSRTLRASLEMGSMVQRAFAVVLLTASSQLLKRKRAAWAAAEFLLFLSFLRGLTAASGKPHMALVTGSALLFAALFWFRKDFRCPTGRMTRKRTALFLLMAVAGTAVNVGISWYYVRLYAVKSGEMVTLWQGFSEGLGAMFGMGAAEGGGRLMRGAEDAVFWFSWACILAAFLYALQPWMRGRITGEQERQHARTLLKLYGQNPCSYLALEDDKTLYFGRTVDGVLPYGTVRSTVVVNGDPVCADADFPAFLKEFKEFCTESAHSIFFLGLTDRYIDEYKRQGFGIVKSGEEARFRLADYEISGKKGAKMRMNINHAKKAGITVKEYRVLEQRDAHLDAEFDRITNEWLSGKKSDLIQFTMGTVGLDNPMDKRYFYAENADGRMVAFIVFVPFLGTRGYMADVTRHGMDAPGGVMETLIYEAFQAFKAEGVEYGSLGVAPLAGLAADSKNPVERLLRFVYENLNQCYGFRDLYRAKEKYSPTEWVPSYYAYLPRVPGPEMLYAVVEIQNPHGIRGYAKAIVREWAEKLGHTLRRADAGGKKE